MAVSRTTRPVLEAILFAGFERGAETRLCDGLASVTRIAPWGEVGKAFTFTPETLPDLILLRPDESHQRALQFLETVRTSCPDVPVVISVEESNADLVIRYIRAGAYDCMAGALTGQRLASLIECIGQEKALAREKATAYFSKSCPPKVPIVGRSLGMVKALEMMRVVGQSRCNPVLILGATGTGKESAALAIHAWRYGDTGNFVAVNCAALTANLLESELFGHVRGAFTGADRDKTGLFEVAADGSLFLDEISEMPMDLQAKLLRVLQERVFRKVGGTSDIACNATVIASSNRNLFHETQHGRFRRDLYYRLAVFPISLPPLNSPDRRDDIPLLARYFAESFQAGSQPIEFTAEAIDTLLRHDWPGNVRELKNVVERALILERSNRIAPDSLFIEREGEAEHRQPATAPQPADFSLETAEREFIYRALKEVGWQRSKAAALLGITRATLLAKIKRYDIQVPGAASAPAPAAEGGAAPPLSQLRA